MSYSTNSTQFGSLAWYYDYGNGTILYFNGSYPMNFVCNATIDADPDIAGPGVIVSFVATAWITAFVAAVPAFYELLDWLSKIKARLRSSASAVNKRAKATPFLAETANRLLESLCDLQVITGTAIVVAGLSQFPAISFYHENLAIEYWWLTLNSFWAARMKYMQVDPKEDSQEILGHVIMRKVGILISVVLGLVFQSIINIRESRDRNFLGPGACFLAHDNSSTWPWVVGTAVYAVSLLFTIIPATRNKYSGLLDRGLATLIQWQRKSFDKLRTGFSHPSTLHNKAFCLAILVISSSSVIFCWLFIQFLSIWSY